MSLAGAAGAAVGAVRYARTRAKDNLVPELLGGLLASWVILTIFIPFKDNRYILPFLVYAAVLGTAWIVTLPRRWRMLGAAAVVAVSAMNFAAVSLGLGGTVSVEVPGISGLSPADRSSSTPRGWALWPPCTGWPRSWTRRPWGLTGCSCSPGAPSAASRVHAFGSRTAARSSSPGAARPGRSTAGLSRVLAPDRATSLSVAPRPPVDVVVPFRGDLGQLAALQERLGRLRLAAGDSLLVVDNTPGREPSGFAEGSVLRAGEIATPAYARNRGAAEGNADWIAFLDADVTPEPDLLDRLFEPPPAQRTALLAGGVRDEQVPARRALGRPLRLPARRDEPGRLDAPRPLGLPQDRQRRLPAQRLRGGRRIPGVAAAPARTPTWPTA